LLVRHPDDAQRSRRDQAAVPARERPVRHLERIGDVAQRSAAVDLQGVRELPVELVEHE
jgi:hypothetical protein